ncbi:hypothetical protein SPRG_10189 [Saprolegnia parasitica CBS 223.65]|uniref:Histone-lysine N-methyltransferase n=1 Tax=Saprolegnia parasitica (strain CBS 223.65) TaxID=695850 RepID=A0A067CDP7_SAPPC|nr:hypothetical protein SPRG_10189 [Saprolegnia parasitica CBS 223.65]KDO24656.1 hypothetical protein SPRG_10189 [Saprolegnia parasitica CBS 223.65]|eukprot:XP_012204724.1 hypothetical protein SPRG_10189 [Saprolegnia parasitica CBS 223.65]
MREHEAERGSVDQPRPAMKQTGMADFLTKDEQDASAPVAPTSPVAVTHRSNSLSSILNDDDGGDEPQVDVSDPKFSPHVVDLAFVAQLEAGANIDAKCQKDFHWYASSVVAKTPEYVKVHFVGYGPQYDRIYYEDSYDCLAPEDMYTRDAKRMSNKSRVAPSAEYLLFKATGKPLPARKPIITRPLKVSKPKAAPKNPQPKKKALPRNVDLERIADMRPRIKRAAKGDEVEAPPPRVVSSAEEDEDEDDEPMPKKTKMASNEPATPAWLSTGRSDEELRDAVFLAATRRAADELANPQPMMHMDKEICASCVQVDDEQMSDLVYCDGPCCRVFHQCCLGLDDTDVQSAEPFFCDDCKSGQHDCFLCGEPGAYKQNLLRCDLKGCGRFYHFECIVRDTRFDVDERSFHIKCPAHHCWTCDVRRTKDANLMQCLKCPTSYHPGCIPPSARYNNVATICGKHKDPLPDVPPHYMGGDIVHRDGKVRFPELYLPKDTPLFDDASALLHFRLSRAILEEHNAQPPRYQKLKRNRYLFKPGKNPDLNDMPRCVCTETCGDDCINRAIFVECVGDGRDGSAKMFNCNLGPGCGNRALQECKIPTTAVVPCGSKGFGLKTLAPIKGGDLVVEYVGEVINEEMKTKRLGELHDINWYIMALVPGRMYIDGRFKGSESRFINHSCDPNCHLLIWDVGEHKRIAITALRDIEPNEELSYDYQMETTAASAFTCYCGAATCRGTMAPDDLNNTKEEKAAKKAAEKAAKKPAKKTKKRRVAKAAEPTTSGEASDDTDEAAVKREDEPTPKAETACDNDPMGQRDVETATKAEAPCAI